jgi:pyruvate,water dikinase
VTIVGRIIGRHRGAEAVRLLQEKHRRFREVIDENNRVLELIADAEEKLSGEYIFDRQYLKSLAEKLAQSTRGVVYSLNAITDNRYPELVNGLEAIGAEIQAILGERTSVPGAKLIFPLQETSGDLPDVIGHKMARLGELRNKAGCRTPEGFVISAAACQRFLDELATAADLQRWLDLPPDCEESALLEAAAGLKEHFGRARFRARLPEEIAEAIHAAVAALEKEREGVTLAVRSSALDEDGALSFAGQYRSLLGVTPARAVPAYLEVLASLYSLEAMRYRRNNNIAPARGLMAVGCLCMVETRAAGVLYTLDPGQPQNHVMLVTASHGLGKIVVEGTGGTDRFVLGRQQPHEVVSRSLGRKEWMYAPRPGGGVHKVRVPPDRVGAPSIGDAKLAELAATALRIEKHMKRAQDIEWALDEQEELYVLQARPLRIAPQRSSGGRDLSGIADRYPVLLSGRGEVACGGIAHGHVCLVDERPRLDDLPNDAVLVARYSRPVLAGAMAKARAVITDVGTATGHLATIARELRVPALVDTEIATQVLRDGAEITVDTEENVVYQGRVDELIHYSLLNAASYRDTPEFRLLQRMLRKIAPLHLKDPASARFTSNNCSTYHDVIRFAHEKAVEALIQEYPLKAPGLGQSAFRLELPVPLDLLLIDLGDGLVEGVAGRSVVPRQVVSAPLRALLEGLTAEGIWSRGPADMDFDGFMSSATHSGALTGPFAPPPQLNLALVSANYLNLNLKLGYHFNTVDCFMSELRNANFIHFRFAGGVTEMRRRARRAEILQRILEQHGFFVECKGDLVIGSVKKISRDAMVERMQMIGRLIGYTRQLDISLRDHGRVEQLINSFMRGEYGPLSRRTEMQARVEILVLDDESIVCERLNDYLENQGYLVETFGDSQQAIDRLRQKRFDVVITDLKMKGPTGLDIVHFIRQQDQHTQTIIITGFATMEAARDAEYCEVVDFIHKPFQLDKLGAAVKKAAKKAARLRKQVDQ